MISAVLGGGIWYYYRRQVNELENIQADVTGVSVNNFTMDSASFNVMLKLTSNSTIEAKITQFDLNVYIGTYPVAIINNVPDIPVIVPAKGFSNAQVQVNLVPKQVFSDIPDLARLYNVAGNLPLVIKGTARVKSAFVTVNIPVEYDTTFNDIFGKIQLPDAIKKLIALL
jgi:hypothetical protein